MFQREKNLLLFTPYIFPNGCEPQTKFFLVLKKDASGKSVVASLPTSKDHIPTDIDPSVVGCINDNERMLNCYKLRAKDRISDASDFSFDVDTFIYGETVDIIEVEKLRETYKEFPKDYRVICELQQELYEDIISCLQSSKAVKRKVKRALM